MMSELSARLLAGSGISFAGGTGGSKTTSSMSHTSSSGYAGDGEQHRSQKNKRGLPVTSSMGPPSYIQMLGVKGLHHHHHASPTASASSGCEDTHLQKRRKLHHSHLLSKSAESNYAASTVLHDLEKGGMAHKSLIRSTQQVRQTSLLPSNANLDLTKVSLVTASDYLEQESAFMKNDYLTADVYTNGSTLTSLLHDCSGFYRSILNAHSTVVEEENKTTASPLNQQNLLQSSNVTASAGSGTNDEGGNDANSQSSRSSGRSESGSCTSSMTDNSDEGAAETGSEDAATPPSPSAYIRMGDALSSSKLPRLIALSFKPFVVVHVNGPYTELTGQNSIGVLGKPLHDMFVQDPLVAAALQTSCADFTLASLDGQAIKMVPNSTPPSSDSSKASSSSFCSSRSSNSGGSRRRSASSPCTVRVRPIGQDGESGHITHYLLEIVQVGDKDLLEDDEDDREVVIQQRRMKKEPSSPHSNPIEVMG